MKKTLLILLAFCLGFQVFAQDVITLEDCRNLALNANKNVLIAKEKIKEANELKKAAFAQFLPNISANGAYMWNERNISLLSENALLPVGTKMADGSFGFTPDQISNKWTMINGKPVPLDATGTPFNPATNPEKILWKNYAYLPKDAMSFDMKNIFVADFGLTQPIFLGGKIRELYRIAKSTEALAGIQYDNEKQKLIIEVDEAYWRVVSLENKCKLAEKFCTLLSKLENDVIALEEEGFATKGDVLKVKVKLNEAQMNMTKAENGLSLSKMALYQLCGLQMEGNYKLADTDIQQGEEYVEGHDMDEIWALRPEVKALEQMDKIAQSGVNIAWSRFMPNIALQGGYMVSNPNVFNGFNKKFDGMFHAGVVVNVPIFHFGDRVHTLKAAKSRKRMADLHLQEAKEKIELQVTQSGYKIAEANKNLRKAISNIEKADENLRFATEAFKEGIIGSTELMEAQTAWMAANSEKIDAGIDVKLCKLYLQKATGKMNIK